jgi:hypothetical protein
MVTVEKVEFSNVKVPVAVVPGLCGPVEVPWRESCCEEDKGRPGIVREVLNVLLVVVNFTVAVGLGKNKSSMRMIKRSIVTAAIIPMRRRRRRRIASIGGPNEPAGLLCSMLFHLLFNAARDG